MHGTVWYLIQQVFVVEWESAREEDVQHHAQAPHVCTFVVAPLASLGRLPQQHLREREGGRIKGFEAYTWARRD